MVYEEDNKRTATSANGSQKNDTDPGGNADKQKGSASPSIHLQIPQISFPQGGGAIKGIDEKYEVNASNGTASFNLPIPLSASRNGFVPTLSLSYNSGGGNSAFGLGWGCDVPTIQRKTDKKIPLYQEESDHFIFSGVEDLVPVLEFVAGQWQQRVIISGDYIIRPFKPRIEGSYSRIEYISHPVKGEYWKVTTRNNTITIFGNDQFSRIADPFNSRRIFKWLPVFSFDNMGNWIIYEYKKENLENVPASVHEKNRLAAGTLPFSNFYLKRIQYGNHLPYYLDEAEIYDPAPPLNRDHFFEVVFDYGEHDPLVPTPLEDVGRLWPCREDAFSFCRAGFEIRTYRLCQRILLFHHFEELGNIACLVRSMDLSYSPSSINESGQQEVTYLDSVIQSGYIRTPDNTYSKKSLPPMTFEYARLQWDHVVRSVSPEDIIHAPAGLGAGYQWVDLYGEGIAGMLTEQGDGWFYKNNFGDVDEDKSARFSFAQQVIPKPSFLGLQAGTLTLQDLDGNGKKQVVVNSEGLQGYFELADDMSWQTFRAFESRTNLRVKDTDIRLFDVNGDGLPDIVMSEENVFTWYPSRGTRGYDQPFHTAKPFNEEQGAALVFTDPLQTIFIADLNGDGMPDIVRIRNGDTCYWPNLGYGRFGAKITMSNAPVFDHPDHFNPDYLQLADISGTGATDLIYLGKNSFTAYLNLSGNAWSNAHTIDPFQHISKKGQVSVIDLLGTGTACLVWSSDLPADSRAPMKYIDLMNSRKPHLLVKYLNNLGKETSFDYKSSTWFYLKDKLAGNPWITRLSFPVQVLQRVTVEEKITNKKFSTEYRYHHGYYDHAEREFRGFGMVEQTDTDIFTEWTKNNAGTQLERSESLFQQPVFTKTWFHTGAFLDKERLLTHFEHEYWYHEYTRQGFTLTFTEPALPDALITIGESISGQLQLSDLSIDEYREALRSCKGMMMRQEIFSLDTTALSNTAEIQRGLTPYSVATHNCHIQVLQPRGPNPYAVFCCTESEALVIHYERDANDPRIGHTLNTRIDELGQVLEKACIAYPRVLPDAALPAIVQAEQAKTSISYHENTFTNDFNLPRLYRLRLPATARVFELTNISKAAVLYRLHEFHDVLGIGTIAIAYHQVAGLSPSRRMIEDQRTSYLDDTLTTELSIGSQGNTGLKYQQYQLAFTPALLQDVFGNKMDDLDPDPSNRPDTLMPQGKFVHLQGDINWWIPSGSISNLRAGETLDDARAHFYSPVLYTDPFGAVVSVNYYKDYFLLIDATSDALLNTSTVEAFDFYTLKPAIIRDPNDNLSASIYDELGMIKAVASLGKDLDNDGIAELDLADDLNGLDKITSAAEQAAIQAYFNTGDSELLRINGRNLLQHATIRYVYDLDKYRSSGAPLAMATITREIHHADASAADAVPVSLLFEYTDGMCKPVMSKVQTSPGIAQQVTVNDDGTYSVSTVDTSLQLPQRLRWIGNGRTVLNNKGKPVKQYEPYFSTSPFYETAPELVETGVSPVIFYDPLGRISKTALADGSFTQIFFTGWKRTVYDVNDTILQSRWYNERFNHLIDAELLAEGKDPLKEKEAAEKAADHNDTPFVMHVDSLGRDVLPIEHNRVNGSDEFYQSHTLLDIEGNVRAIINNRGNTVMSYRHDMLGHAVYQHGMDSGERWILNNVNGQAVKSWDNRSHIFLFTYDILHRNTESRVMGGDGPVALNNIFSRTIYGEGLVNDKRNNLRGKVAILYDTAGKVESGKFDVKGNLLLSSRKLAIDYKNTVNWPVINPDALLESDTWFSSAEYDALSRATRQVFPDGTVLVPSYNETSQLKKVQVTQNAQTDIFVKDISYNEKGQRIKIIYGNDVSTRYYFDKKTFRLLRLETKKITNEPLQDNYFTYDAVGNITHIEDKNIPDIFFNNQKIQGISRYTFDPLYRLVSAEGREHIATVSFGANDNYNDITFLKQYNQGDSMAWRNYVQEYQYDSVGNLLKMRHQAPGGNWLRDYEIAAGNNRMLSSSVNSETYTYTHHAQHGFITAMPHLQVMQWNFKEQLQAVAAQALANGTPETTYYVYDGSGLRIRKITERQAAPGSQPGRKSQRLYLGAVEIYTEYDTTNQPGSQTTTLHILDDKRRIAMIDTTIATRLVRYQFDNHINSACLETDELARVISYEEYHPYGTTAYQAMDKNITTAYKRYRYIGMERDEESGFQYHKARYYLPWLGRWLSVDPIGTGDGLNVYQYARGNPVTWEDANGNSCGTVEATAGANQKKAREERKAAEKAAEAAAGPPGGNGEVRGGASKEKDDAGGSIGDKIVNGIKGFGKWIGEAAGKIWDFIKGAASAIWNWIKGAATTAWEWIKGAASSVWNWIKGAAATAWNWIKDGASAAWNWIKGAAKTVWEWTKEKAIKFWNWFAGDDGFAEDFLEVVGHLTWGLPGTALGLAITLLNLTLGNLLVAIHNIFTEDKDDWDYGTISIGGPNDEDDIIGNYGGLLNLLPIASAITFGPFVFFEGSGPAAKARATTEGFTATSVRDYYRQETGGSIYQSKTNLRIADHEEGHEDQNLLYGPFTLLFGLIFSLVANPLESDKSSGIFWFDHQANKWSGKNSPFNPKLNVH